MQPSDGLAIKQYVNLVFLNPMLGRSSAKQMLGSRELESLPQRRPESQAIGNQNEMIAGLQKQVGEIVSLLVEGRFGEIESLTNGMRLPAEQIKAAVGEYGRTLVLPPADAFSLMDVIEIRNASPPSWSIIMPLWTKEEGRSDLSLELTLVKEGLGFKVELDDIHVL